MKYQNIGFDRWLKNAFDLSAELSGLNFMNINSLSFDQRKFSSSPRTTTNRISLEIGLQICLKNQIPRVFVRLGIGYSSDYGVRSSVSVSLVSFILSCIKSKPRHVQLGALCHVSGSFGNPCSIWTWNEYAKFGQSRKWKDTNYQ